MKILTHKTIQTHVFNVSESTPNFDAFGRLRVSNPYTLFDSSHRFADNGLWTAGTATGGTVTFNSAEGLVGLAVTAASGSEVVRETTKVFSYQPGKSLLVFTTFVMSTAKTNLRQRIGYYGANNGYYLEQNGTTVSFVERSFVTGGVVNTPVAQASWNVDPMNGTGPSGITLDLTKAQILFMDLEWLGVGTVRIGFVIKEEIHVEQDKNEPVIDTNDSTSEPEQPVLTEPVVETKQPEPEPVHEDREANITEQLSIGPDIVEEFDEIISAPKKQQDKQIPLDNVTLCDVGGGYVKYNNHLYQKDALKEINPELFRLKPDQPSMPNSGFGTAFPKIAQKKDIFVRVDVIPNKVYRFEGSKWIEINKNLSNTYLYDQEYIKYLIDKISNGEYDIELLSEQEKNQIDEYLNTQNQYK